MNEHHRHADGNQNRPVRFSRRTLLRLGAAGLVSFAFAPAVGAARTALRSPSEPATLPVTIGYAPFGDDSEDIRVVAAESLDAGQADVHLTGVVLRLHGLCTDNAGIRAAHIEQLSIDVSFAPFHDAVFPAWSFQNAAAASSSCPTALTVPIDTIHGLNMHLTVRQKEDHQLRHIPLQLALSHGNHSKLREGRYFVGLPGQNGSLPEWDGYLVRNDPDTRVVSHLTSSGASPESSGPIFMFSVELAG